MSKHTKGDLAHARKIQRLICKANGLPSPPSRFFDGVLRNFCPACEQPTVSGPPWSCSSCGWDAKAKPEGCCRRISPIRKHQDGSYVLDLLGADEDNPRLTGQSKKDLKDAKNAAVDVSPDDLTGEEVADE